MKRILLITAFCLVACVSHASDIIEHLQDVSCTIKSGSSQGSGVLFTRKDGDHTRTFVITADHCVDDLRKTREVVVKGDHKTVVEFGDAKVVNEFYQGERRIGETTLDAKVLRYSEAEQGEDLALLEIRKRDYLGEKVSAEFIDGAPELGTELWHVGSLLGQFGSNSLTSGIVSKIGRVLDLGANGKVFDQVAVGAFPGSSGGGVFRKSDGKCIGILVRGAGEGMSFIVPARHVREWAKSANIEWALDRSVKLPSDSELAKLPVEDASSTNFSPPSRDSKSFPLLIYKEQ